VLPGDPSSQTMVIVGICIGAHLIHLHNGNACSHLAYEHRDSVSAVACGNRSIYQGL
jgi:carbamoylphosphate synthase small subunit